MELQNENFTIQNNNETDAATENFHTAAALFWTALTATLAVSAMFFNALILLATKRSPMLQEPTNYLIANLAAADFAVALSGSSLYSPSVIWKVENWPKVICYLSICFPPYVQIVSFTNIVCITVDRYIAISRSLRYHELVTHSRVKVIIPLCWAIPLLIVPMEIADAKLREDCDVFFSIGDTSIIIMSILFCLVVIVMFAIYIRITTVAFRHRKRIDADSHESQGFIKQLKVAKVLFAVVGTFVLLWAPFFTTIILRLKFGQEAKEIIDCCGLTVAVLLCCILNTLANPLIYSFMISEYRAGIKKVFKCFQVT